MIIKGEGKKAILMLHGRGANAEDIISLHELFNATSYAITAENNEWYPKPFMQQKQENEPKLSQSLKIIHETTKKIREKHSEVYILGFSQGACLALEYSAENKVNGVIAFSGGLIGQEHELVKEIKTKKAFISCSTNDPFIPITRAKKTAEIYKENQADTKTNFYEGNTHTITKQEIQEAKEHLGL